MCIWLKHDLPAILCCCDPRCDSGDEDTHDVRNVNIGVVEEPIEMETFVSLNDENNKDKTVESAKIVNPPEDTTHTNTDAKAVVTLKRDRKSSKRQRRKASVKKV